MRKECTVYIIEESGEKHAIKYFPLEHFNLMELVEDKLNEEWGDCKGRAMCGTCHVDVEEGDPGTPEPYELQKLEELPNKTSTSRLACQIVTDEQKNNMIFRILRDY